MIIFMIKLYPFGIEHLLFRVGLGKYPGHCGLEQPHLPSKEVYQQFRLRKLSA
jgi:hypothetical protein